MISFQVVLGTVFGFVTLISFTSAACNNCTLGAPATCINETAYKLCINDDLKPDDTIHSCPGGQVCTDAPGICKPKGSGDALGCTEGCNVCAGNFACLTTTKYALCNATTNTTTSITGECTDGKVCSTSYLSTKKAICGSTCNTQPTCLNTAPVSPTTAKPTIPDYEASCISMGNNGNYPVIHEGVTSCQIFVSCERLNGTIYSTLQSCSPQFFDSNQRTCVSEKPNGCSN